MRITILFLHCTLLYLLVTIQQNRNDTMGYKRLLPHCLNQKRMQRGASGRGHISPNDEELDDFSINDKNLNKLMKNGTFMSSS